MPRIPETEIERIKRSTDLVALARSRGIELRKHGSRDFAGKCPFHADDQPSFIVSPDKNLFHCMGCGAAGNAIQFVEKFDGVSFRHAFELLNDGRAVFSPPSPSGERVKVATVPRLNMPFDPECADAELFLQVIDFYHERLLKTPDALDYLKSRGVYSEEAVEKFRIGFADRTLGLRMPEANRKAGSEIRTRLQKLGIIRESGHEHFSGSVIIPVFRPDGSTGEMYGRKINDHLRAGTPRHLYLPGPHEGIWHADECFAGGELILCEAPLDALTFWTNGFKNVTFIYGTEGFNDELFDAILAHKIGRIKIAYDADDAGNRAAERDIKRLTAQGIECFRIKFPHRMDANEYACKVRPPGKALQAVLNAAEWAGRGGSSQSEGCAGADINNKIAANLAAKEKAAASPEQGPCDEKKASSETLAISASLRETSSILRSGEYHLLQLGKREYRVGGLEKNNSLEVLKVSLRLMVRPQRIPVAGSQLPVEDGLQTADCKLQTETDDVRFHLDSFDMARDGDRRRFIERAAEETGLEKELIKRDLGKLLLALEQAQQDRLDAALKVERGALKPEMSAEERSEALSFLKAPDLIERITSAFPVCGLAGESLNTLSSYLACTSRKLERPLAVIIQSTSAAGKSMLMESALSMFPEEDRIKYSAMTGQSLYYLGETNLKHKILAIVEEEGAEKASYALKLLQSEGELTIASTGKDPHTGRMETQEYHVEGPVMIFLTTTAVEIDEELLNRCLILTVDESREQTERIHAIQRKARTIEGLSARQDKQRILRVLRNAQRLLQPLAVVNPYAGELTFTAERTRTRRDHEKYLTLIDAIALLHQHQRKRSQLPESGNTEQATEFIEVTLSDIELANRLALELLGRSLDDLPPQTRRVLETIKAVVREICDKEQTDQSAAFFSRREIRGKLGWGITQIREHLERLRELEYITARYGRPGASYQYELLTDCRETSEKAHIGLLNVEKLRLRQPTCREKTQPVGGCRNGIRQVQSIEKTRLITNLSGDRERTSGASSVAIVS